MSRFLVSLGTATLVLLTAPSVQAAPVSIRAAVQSLTDHEIAYAKKGGWKGEWKHGRGWGHHRSWRWGPPPWAPAWGWRRKHGL